MEILKYAVIILLPILAFLISKRYSGFVDRELGRARGYYAFICHIERKIGVYLSPPDRLGEGFSDPYIADMIRMIEEGTKLLDAYLACRGNMPSDVDKVLLDFFSDFGISDASLELRRAREASLRLEKVLSDESARGEKQKRICATVAPSLAIGLVIWLI